MGWPWWPLAERFWPRPIALPVLVTTVGGYFTVGGGVVSAISQLTTLDEGLLPPTEPVESAKGLQQAQPDLPEDDELKQYDDLESTIEYIIIQIIGEIMFRKHIKEMNLYPMPLAKRPVVTYKTSRFY